MGSLLLKKLRHYEKLMASFLDKSITAEEFESQYLLLFKNDEYLYDDNDYSPLNRAFGAIDAFCDDESLIGKYDINEGQLRAEISQYLENLRERISILED